MVTETFDLGANLLRIRKKKSLSQDQLGESVGVSGAQIGRYEKGKDEMSNAMLRKLCIALDVSEIEMRGLKEPAKLTPVKNKEGMIPIYDAIAVAGLTTMAAEQSAVYEAVEYIDAGTLFPTATAAMRIAGDSMFPKYRPGCLVALREVFDKEDIDYGKDYVIETKENRWIKRLMKSEKGAEHVELTSYSTVTDARGKLVHAARDIHLDKIKRIYRVLGQVLHESGGEDILHRGNESKMAINLKET